MKKETTLQGHLKTRKLSPQAVWETARASMERLFDEKALSLAWKGLVSEGLDLDRIEGNTLVFRAAAGAPADRAARSLGIELAARVIEASGTSIPVEAVTVQIEPASGAAVPWTMLEGESVRLEEFLGDSLYETLVRPGRIISIPQILLRWLPAIGTLRLSMVVAMRQVMYLRGIKTGSSSSATLEATYEELADWAGVDEKSFRAHVDDPELQPFFRRIPAHGPTMVYDAERGHIKRAASRYQVSASLPLPPGDYDAFRRFFSDLLKKSGSLDAALSHCGSIEPKDIFSFPFPPVPSGWNKRCGHGWTVRDAVLSCSGGLLTAAQEVQVAAISGRLVPEKRANIQIPWYRMRRWMPVLGQSRGWFTILCESRVYSNAATGEVRSTARIAGGYQWFSLCLGMDERTIRRWFKPGGLPRSLSEPDDPELTSLKARSRALDQTRRADVAGFLNRFVSIESESRRRNRVEELVIRVADAEPLIPAHEITLQAGIDLGEHFLSLDEAARKAFLVDLHADRHLSFAREPGTDSRFASGEPGTNSRFEDGEPGTDSRFKDIEPGTDSRLNLARIPVLKGLLLKDIGYQGLIDFLNTINTRRPARAAVAQDGWDVPAILKRSVRSASKAKQLLAAGLQAGPLISYLLYAASPAGANTTAGYLVRQLEAVPDKGAGWPYDGLAALPPEVLAAHVRSAWHPFEDLSFVPSPEWDAAMTGATRDKLNELAYRLGLSSL